MAYIDELLGRDEQVLYVGQQHPFTLISNILAELFLIALLIAAGVFSQRAFNGSTAMLGGMPLGGLVLLICVAISVIVLISAFVDYLRWSQRQYIITDQRVIQVEGVFNKEVSDSSLEKINDLELRQSWIGRIMDYGDLSVLTGADVGINDMRQLAHPLDFKRTLIDAKHNLSRGFGYFDPQSVAAYTAPSGPTAQRAPGTEELEQTLLKLADLRDRGLISVEEFEEKKRDLLSRI